MSFLAEVAAISDKNGMTASNIAIVFGPNLCWKQGMGPSSGVIPDLGDLGKIKAFTEFLFVNHEAIFEGLEKAGYSAQTL